MTCGTCVFFDPVDGYCVQHAIYRREDDSCVEHRKPKKQMFVMEAPEERMEITDWN